MQLISVIDPLLKLGELQTILSRWRIESSTAFRSTIRQMKTNPLVLPGAQDFVKSCGSATHKDSDRSMARSQARSSAVCRRAVAVLLCVMLFTMDSLADAAPLNVGGGAGWTVQHNYGHLTARRGDVLSKCLHPSCVSWSSPGLPSLGEDVGMYSTEFNYNSRFHNVLQITQNEYNECLVPSKAIEQYSSGRDSVSLNKPGTYFFICGFPGHCAAGMKVAVTVH